MAEAAAYIAANQAMNDHLENNLGVTNQGLRVNMQHGFRDPDDLATKDKDIISKLCYMVRRIRGGQAATKRVTADIEEDLKRTAMWCRYNNMTRRPLDLQLATKAAIDDLHYWSAQLQDSSDSSSVEKFNDKGDMRAWFEKIQQYLGDKKGASGVPLE